MYVLAFDTANETIALGLGVLRGGEDKGAEGEGAAAENAEGKGAAADSRAGANASAPSQDLRVECVASMQLEALRASNTRLLTCVDELLAGAQVTRADLACVVCGRGPGSFTGVRIALATAKGMASALRVPLIPVSTTDSVAWGAWKQGARGSVVVLADAMRHEIYPVEYSLTDSGIARLNADCVEKVEALAERLAGQSGLQLAGDGLTKYADLFAACGQFLPQDMWTPTGEGLLLAFQDLMAQGLADPFDRTRHNPAIALPVYTRLSDAEESERMRFMQTRTHTTMSSTSILNAPADARGVSYKPLDPAHAACVASLESRAMGSDAWTADMVADELGRKDRSWWAAYLQPDPLAEPQFAGYAGALIVDGDVEILKIAVEPEARRRGIARKLLAYVANDARDLGATTSSLEVRLSNEGAQAFYESAGYQRAGVRRGYYSDGEDAVIMQGPLPLLQADVAGMDLQVAALSQQVAATQGAGENAGEVAESAENAGDSAENACGNVRENAESVESAKSTTACAAKAVQPETFAQLKAPFVHPLIFAIESSCDETAAAIVDGNGTLLADVVASQIDFHARFGGVVPEIASRKHIEAICGVCDECFAVAAAKLGVPGLGWTDMDAVAVTYAPGLLGALVVGVAFAKGAAWAANKPLIGVNHLEGHLYANKIGAPDFTPPAVVSLVSGGNTLLVHMQDWGLYHTLGCTIDDAVGEAFDKVAKALGLGYPGGPVVSRYAAQGRADAIAFPRAMLHSGDLCFSLSGLKTAVVSYINQQREAGVELNVPDICASFQAAVVDVQVAKAATALEETGAEAFCLGGGVAANPALRHAYEEMCVRKHVRLVMPPMKACGDNAGMIALVALDRYKAGKFFDLTCDALAHTNLDEPY